MAVLRITAPAEMAGMRVIQGNQGPQVNLDAVNEADLVVIQRDFPRFWQDYRQIIAVARDQGKPVVYDLDDLLVEIPDHHSHRGDYVGEMLVMLYAIIDADLVTASSPYLQGYLSDLNPNTRLISNYLHDGLWTFKEPEPVQGGSARITIGYMGGQTHQADLDFIGEVLIRIYKKYPDLVKYKFWGAKPPAELLELSSTEWIAINQEDYARFTAFFSQQECDIFIAPLLDEEFNRAKSSLKFLEYAVLGAAGVYSQLPPYEDIVEHGVNGFLAKNHQDWEEHLVELIENPSLREQIALAAQKTVKDGWLLSNNHHQLGDIYRQVLQGSLDRQRENKNLKRIIAHAERYQSGLEGELFAASNQLSEIHNSRSWRMLKKIQNFRLKVLPRQ